MLVLLIMKLSQAACFVYFRKHRKYSKNFFTLILNDGILIASESLLT